MSGAIAEKLNDIYDKKTFMRIQLILEIYVSRRK